MTKKYHLTLSRNYVASWGVAEAVRELIQNALDSERPFEFQFENDVDECMALSIHSPGVVLSPSTLLLGTTTKANDETAIGSFGEGFKIALLVLCRLGKHVAIRNGLLDWLPGFELNRLFGEEMLVIREKPARRENRGLIFEIYGLTQSEVESIRASCLMMQGNYGLKIQTGLGEILEDRPGELYVGNLFVCKTKMRFGYNVLPKYLRLDRDRQTVSDYDLGDVVLRMWEETGRFDFMAEMVDEEALDMQNARWAASESLQKACYERFRRAHPTALVASTQSEMESLKRSAPSVVRVSAGMYGAISAYPLYRTARSAISAPSPTDQLRKFLRDNSELFYYDELKQRFEELIETSKNWSAD